jgi:hypothetical protein
MADAPLLREPPDDGHLWIPPDALPGVTISYTLGRNNDGYLLRAKRTKIHVEISHTMSGPFTETMQGFANGERPEDATLAEVASFTDGTLLQSLPLDIIGAGSVDGGLTGLTHESAELEGDPEVQPWTPIHLATKAKLSAWLIRNPLSAAGDRKWRMLDIRYQVCQAPNASAPELGGLGYHTMWGKSAKAEGGTNPWTKTARSCPGSFRRGTDRDIPFPNGVITDIPLKAGNYRDYYETVGRLLADQSRERTAGGDDDMPTHRWSPKGFNNQFEMPGCLPVTPADVGPTGSPTNTADPFADLPLIVDFHIQRLKAVIHRNGITAVDLAAGYFERNQTPLTAGEQAAYEGLGIRL